MELKMQEIQTGFRKGRGTRDPSAIICWLLECAKEFENKTSLCFIDNSKSFDCTDQKKYSL